MPDTKISALPLVTSVVSSDLLAVVQSSSSFALNVSQLFTRPNFPDYYELHSTTDPSTPSASTIRVYAKQVAGRTMPKWMPPSGIDSQFQPALFGNNIVLWSNLSTGPGLWLGGTTGTSLGAYVNTLPTTTSTNYFALKRARYANSSASVSLICGPYQTDSMWWRGGSTGQGGFFFHARFGFELFASTGTMFVGFASTQTAVQNPRINNVAAFISERTDSRAISFYTQASSATLSTKTATITTIVAGDAYDAYIFARPNDSVIYYRLDDLNTGATIVDTSISTNLPNSTVALRMNCLATNGSTASTSSLFIGVNRMYCEADR